MIEFDNFSHESDVRCFYIKQINGIKVLYKATDPCQKTHVLKVNGIIKLCLTLSEEIHQINNVSKFLIIHCCHFLVGFHFDDNILNHRKTTRLYAVNEENMETKKHTITHYLMLMRKELIRDIIVICDPNTVEMLLTTVKDPYM